MKKLLYLFLLLPFTTFAQGGFGSGGALEPLGGYPIVSYVYVKGAPQSVTTIIQRDALPTYIRVPGLLCYVADSTKYYSLQGGIANINWATLSTSGTNLLPLSNRWTGTLNLFDNNVTINGNLNVGNTTISNTGILTSNGIGGQGTYDSGQIFLFDASSNQVRLTPTGLSFGNPFSKQTLQILPVTHNSTHYLQDKTDTLAGLDDIALANILPLNNTFTGSQNTFSNKIRFNYTSDTTKHFTVVPTLSGGLNSLSILPNFGSSLIDLGDDGEVTVNGRIITGSLVTNGISELKGGATFTSTGIPPKITGKQYVATIDSVAGFVNRINLDSVVNAGVRTDTTMSKLQPYGFTIYNKSYWTGLSDFTSAGFTPIVTAHGGILFSSGAPDYSKYIKINGETNLEENLDIEVTYVATSLSGYGIQIGKKGINANALFTSQVGYDLQNNTFTVYGITIPSTFVVALNDICIIKYSQRRGVLVGTFKDITKGTSMTLTSAMMMNSADIAVFNFGGSVEINQIKATSQSNVKPKLLIIGDSKVGHPNDYQNIAISSASLGVVNLASGNSDKTSDILATIPYDIKHYKPDYVILNVGRNDVLYGISQATRKANYDAINALFIAAGYNQSQIIQLLPIPETVVPDQSSLYNDIVATYTNVLDPVALGWDNSLHLAIDGIHPNSSGSSLIADGLINSGKITNPQSVYPSENILNNFEYVPYTNTANTFSQPQIIKNYSIGDAYNAIPSTSALHGLAYTMVGGSGLYPFNGNANMLIYTAPTAGNRDIVFQSNSINRAYIKASTGEFNIGYTDGISHFVSTGGLLGVNGGGSFTGSISAVANLASGLNSVHTLTPVANNDILSEATFGATFITGTGALTATITTNTTSAADGTYTNQAAVVGTGAGTGSRWTVTVLGGIVTAIVQTTGGVNYTTSTTFTIATVPGALFTVASLGYTNVTRASAQFLNAPIYMDNLGNPTVLKVGQYWNNNSNWRTTDGASIYSFVKAIGTSNPAVGQIPVGNGTSFSITTPTGTGTPVFSISPTFGTSIKINGSTSGTVTIAPQAAAGTYNFNLPITAGTAGQVLTSQAGGTTAMTWTTLPTVLTATATLDFPSTAASTNSELTVTVTGAAIGDVCLLGLPATIITTNCSYSARVTATNTVTVRFDNTMTLTAADPTSASYTVKIIK